MEKEMLFVIDRISTSKTNAKRLEKSITRTLATRGERMGETYLMIQVPGETHQKALAVGIYDIVMYLNHFTTGYTPTIGEEQGSPGLFGLAGNTVLYVMFESDLEAKKEDIIERHDMEIQKGGEEC
jgi:hypothetical protein